MELFPDAAAMSIGPLIFMMIVYGFILKKASELIAEGSEHLLILFGPGIVGGLLIPILGAVPDCAIILISGLGAGTPKEIQEQIAVGVGTLVGSTVMLLTIPWAVGIFIGRRDYDGKNFKKNSSNSEPVKQLGNEEEENKKKDIEIPLVKENEGEFYVLNKEKDVSNEKKPESPPFFTMQGVETRKEITDASIKMMITALSYLIIQIPAFIYGKTKDAGVKEEAPFALFGFIVTVIFFLVYCGFQIKSSKDDNLKKELRKEAERKQWKRKIGRTASNKLMNPEEIFKKYDINGDGQMDKKEFKDFLSAFNIITNSKGDIDTLIKEIDVGDAESGVGDGMISKAEFKKAFKKWMIESQHLHEKEPVYEDEDEEEAEGEEEDMTYGQRLFQAVILLFIGTLICTLVSDPMVDVIGGIGKKMNISAFYISFVVTPLASNASEVISCLIFASKKTKTSISLTLATLHGAAIMNNTLALSIFMALIYFRKLSWDFGAEVISLLVVIIVVGINALRNSIFMWQATIVFMMYPLCIILVYLLNSVAGIK